MFVRPPGLSGQATSVRVSPLRYSESVTLQRAGLEKKRAVEGVGVGVVLDELEQTWK